MSNSGTGSIQFSVVDDVRGKLPQKLKAFLFEESPSFYHLAYVGEIYRGCHGDVDAVIKHFTNLNARNTEQVYGINHPEAENYSRRHEIALNQEAINHWNQISNT